MFDDEQYYESKAFLNSYKDAIDCLRESAEHKNQITYQSTIAKRLMEVVQNGSIKFQNGRLEKGSGFNDLQEVKHYNFSNFLFQKYLGGFEEHTGSFSELQNILNKGISKLEADSN